MNDKRREKSLNCGKCVQRMKQTAADVEEKRSDDEKSGKTPLLLKRSVQMTKSAVKHYKEAYK